MIPFRARVATREIIFVRHAESQANLDGVWNGRTDGPLSEAGRASLPLLASRLANWRFNRVISSPLGRARQTAESFADDLEIDESFIEIDLGEWEGRRFAEIQAEDGEVLKSAIASRSIPMGRTGESIDEAGQRAVAAVDKLFHELEDEERAVVVTHGGFLQSVLHRHLAGRERRAHAFTQNTALTRVVWEFGRPRLANFNDDSHLGPSKMVAEHLGKGTPVLALVRHGRTKANVEGRWQGQGDWDLDELGHMQAEAFGEWYGRWSTVYTSPLRRAASTAERVARNGVVEIDQLKELAMGDWEGLTTDEIIQRWPGTMEKIYKDGIDLKRGRSGESWGELTRRFANAVYGLRPANGEPTVVVAHGGAIRSYVSSLTMTSDTHSESLNTPANTSVTHVALTPEGPEILDYSVAPHL
ncbi:MAG: histidine phosphatase family protein, partial [Acidimicrobiia bacterium]